MSISDGKKKIIVFYKSIWFFPAALFLIVLILSALQINGSSMGMYHEFFYGDSKEDDNLLVNKPRGIRSDEWLTNTQFALSQTVTDKSEVNENLGNGMDYSLLVDAPYVGLSQLFKPHNWGFFFLPTGVAFALRWWLWAYLLIVAVYFLTLKLLAGQKKVAIPLSLAFAASPLLVWWYQYITLAPVYYSIFGMIVAMHMIEAKKLKHLLILSGLLAYIGVSFAVVLYPPFQIPLAIVAMLFVVGYWLDSKKPTLKHKHILGAFIGSGLLIGVMCAAIFIPKLEILQVLQNTAYPGERRIVSGGHNPLLLLGSNSSLLNQSNYRAGHYGWTTNQSEGSQFFAYALFFIPVLLYFLYTRRRKVPYFYTTVGTILSSGILLAWMFVPHLSILGKLLLLERVGYLRASIGLGLALLLILILTIRILSDKKIQLHKQTAIFYASMIAVFYLVLNLMVSTIFPEYMSYSWALLLIAPFPAIVYLVLRKRFVLGVLVILGLSIASTMFIHPLYRGVDMLTETKLSDAIRDIDPTNSKRWVADNVMIESFALLNGKKTLTGVYTYPQLELWQQFGEDDKKLYNRYAHVRFELDNKSDVVIEPQLQQPGSDQLVIAAEPCDNLLKKYNVGYILALRTFSNEAAPCLKLVEEVKYPARSIYIYRLASP